MEASRDDRSNKVALSSKDFLSLESNLQSYITETVQKSTIGCPEERAYIQNAMDEWSSIVCTSLAENSAFTDSDGIGNRAKLNIVDPTNEELKEEADRLELELNANFEKVVKYRAQVPIVLANLSREICESESQEAEQLEIHFPSIETKHQSLEFPKETVKKEYKDAMQLLSKLNKSVPTAYNQLERVQEISSLVMKGSSK